MNRPGAVVAGFILGTVGWLALQVLPIYLTDDVGSYRAVDAAARLIPLAAAVGALIHPRIRRAAAGLVLGAAVGVTVWSVVFFALTRHW